MVGGSTRARTMVRICRLTKWIASNVGLWLVATSASWRRSTSAHLQVLGSPTREIRFKDKGKSKRPDTQRGNLSHLMDHIKKKARLLRGWRKLAGNCMLGIADAHIVFTTRVMGP